MSVESAIFARLSGYAPLLALVPATRIFNMRRPPKTALPCVVFQQVSMQPYVALTATTGLARARYQVTSYGSNPDSAAAVASAVQAALADWAANPVVSSYLLDQRKWIDPDDDTARVDQDWRIMHNNP